jgi:hypothetical protein
MEFLLASVGGLALLGLALGGVLIRKKNMHIWLPDYLRRKIKGHSTVKGPIHIMFCFVDHYEPQWENRDNIEKERARVDRWCRDYPKNFSHIKDADGCMPKHTFFYPEEEYREEHLSKLADLCSQGFGELDIHLHHHDDTAENLKETLEGFAKTLHEQHGGLPVHPKTNKPSYAFIHGNWTLDNSDPHGRFCGVKNELVVLKETGCYADFTLPSAPNPAQTRKVNAIYYATGNPDKSKSHDTGTDVEVGVPSSGDLMIIQGPLGFNWKKRKFGFMPGIENGDIKRTTPPSKHRVDNWVSKHVHVKGKPEWVFVKIHTHGTQENDMDTLLGEPAVSMYEYLASKYNDGEKYVMHFVSSREMFNIIKAAEAGESGNPGNYRDYFLGRPKNCLSS